MGNWLQYLMVSLAGKVRQLFISKWLVSRDDEISKETFSAHLLSFRDDRFN